jgi:hypothetical protein
MVPEVATTAETIVKQMATEISEMLESLSTVDSTEDENCGIFFKSYALCHL